MLLPFSVAARSNLRSGLFVGYFHRRERNFFPDRNVPIIRTDSYLSVGRRQWPTANGKKKKKRLIIISVVAVAVVALVVVAVAATRGGTKIDPTKLAKVEKGDLAKSVVATGKVTPITKVEIKSKASGIVKKLYVDAGDTVKTGPGAGGAGSRSRSKRR